MGGAVSAGVDNDDLTDNLVDAGYVKTNDVERVLRVVDRGMYFLPEKRSHAYNDSAWKEGLLHISAPCIYAEALEALKLEPGNAFLNVGSGTGYFSTMAGLLIGAYGTNHGVELHESNVKYASEHLMFFMRESVAFRYFDFTPPRFLVGNALNLGEDFFNRYDRMYVGAACDDRGMKQLVKYLKIGGSMIAPFNDNLVRLTKRSEEELVEDRLMQVSFQRLVLPGVDGAPDVSTLALPKPLPITLKQACRLVIVRQLRSGIFALHPNVRMPRAHLKPSADRRSQRNQLQRTIFPIYLAENNGDGPHVVLGNALPANEDANQEDVPVAAPPPGNVMIGAVVRLENVGNAEEAMAEPPSAESSDEDDFASVQDDESTGDSSKSGLSSGDENEPLPVNLPSPDNARIRTGRAVLSALRASHAAAGDGPSTSMQAVQGEIQALGSALNDLRESSTSTTPVVAPFATEAAPPPPAAPRAPRRDPVTLRRVMHRLAGKVEQPTAPRPPEPDSVPASEQMDGLMRDAVLSLPVPRTFKRFLNFDRALEEMVVDLT